MIPLVNTMNSHSRHLPIRSILTVILLAGRLTPGLFSQTEKTLQSRVVSATVFNDRALVTRIATSNFKVGKYNVSVNLFVSGAPTIDITMIPRNGNLGGEGASYGGPWSRSPRWYAAIEQPPPDPHPERAPSAQSWRGDRDQLVCALRARTQ